MPRKISMRKGSTVFLAIVFVAAFLVLGVVVAYKYGMLNKQSADSQIIIPAREDAKDEIKDRSGEITQLDSGDKIGDIEQDLDKTDINSLDQDVLGVKTEAQGL